MIHLMVRKQENEFDSLLDLWNVSGFFFGHCNESYLDLYIHRMEALHKKKQYCMQMEQ